MKENFGRFLKEKRQEKGYILRDFAEKSGLSPVVLSKYETNQVIPSSSTLVSILKNLNLPEEEVNRAVRIVEQQKVLTVTSNVEGNNLQRGNRASFALRIAKEMKLSDEEWESIYHTVPSLGGKGGGR